MTTAKPTDDELSALYRESRRRDPWPGSDCPSLEALERFLLGDAAAAERADLGDHLAECTGCAEWVRELRSLEGWAERVALARGSAGGTASHPATAKPAVQLRNAWQRWPVALAASLLLALGGAFLWTRIATPPPDSDATRGALEATTPAPGAQLTLPPQRFAWPPQLGATGYRVQLFDDLGELVWESPWDGESLCPLPIDTAVPWRAGATYLWTVSVRGDVARSQLGPFSFQLGPGAP